MERFVTTTVSLSHKCLMKATSSWSVGKPCIMTHETQHLRLIKFRAIDSEYQFVPVIQCPVITSNSASGSPFEMGGSEMGGNTAGCVMVRIYVLYALNPTN